MSQTFVCRLFHRFLFDTSVCSTQTESECSPALSGGDDQELKHGLNETLKVNIRIQNVKIISLKSNNFFSKEQYKNS